MAKLICVYDNHIQPDIYVKNIIGNKTYGEVILKRKSIKNKFIDFIKAEKIFDEIIYIDYQWQVEGVLEELKGYEPDTKVLHLFSNSIILNEEKVRITFKKLKYIEENYIFLDDSERKNNNYPSCFVIKNLSEYCNFLGKYSQILNKLEIYLSKNIDVEFRTINIDGFFNIENYSNFLKFISGGFDARFFNTLKGDNYIVTKSSTNKLKIKAEYTYYHLLPDEMKKWYVMPYNYKENEIKASYEMERYHMTDLAIRYVHDAIKIDEFEKILEKIFYFLKLRSQKEIDVETEQQIIKDMYLNKVEKRIAELKNYQEILKFNLLINSGTNYRDIDEIIEKYKSLYSRVSIEREKRNMLVIGHGDLCFSNMLYNKELNLLKLIDPKGALEENELWTDIYYDLAKLSHSICGKYDFFNNGLHNISINENLKIILEIDYDNSEYIKVFKNYLEKNNYNFKLVRLYESSLFLSMLPLHMDNPQKVLGFILNAINIMEEIEKMN